MNKDNYKLEELEELEDYVKQLKKIKNRYNKVCEKLDILNEEATSLEQEIMWLSAKLGEGGK